MRRNQTIAMAAGLVILVAGLLAVVSGSSSSTSIVTRARLERSLERTYANRYVALSTILEHPGVTVQSLESHAVCDKGGSTVADFGPGGDWVCQIAYIDPNVDNPDATAKVELNVHSNGCYSALGSTKLVGPLNITDTKGRTVVNPANEFDACFDPRSAADPDGTLLIVNATPLPGATKIDSPLTLPVGHVTLDRRRRLRLQLNCVAGGSDCTGTLDVALMGRSFVTRDFEVAAGAEQTVVVQLSGRQAREGGMITLTPKMDPAGFSASS